MTYFVFSLVVLNMSLHVQISKKTNKQCLQNIKKFLKDGENPMYRLL